ncbi:MAG: hypothetical protein JWO08_1894 [Verrucomicrobiaceae bacterium]|nr:hypothetical protein [Verrucomicrobiaceae bacterium]
MRLIVILALFATLAGAVDFVVPSAAERSRAIGSTEGSRPFLQRAFTENNSLFEPISKPSPNDWLATHNEPPQTFNAFLAGNAMKPDVLHGRLYMLPIGDFPTDVAPSLTKLSDYAQAFFGMPVTILTPVQVDDLPAANRINKHTHNRQLLSTDILNWLNTQKPKDAFAIVAVTMEDLYPESSWNFVFGQASLVGGTGVFSFARYDPQFYGTPRGNDYQAVILARSMKVLVHETGHMFGIRHCTFFRCVMNGSNHLGESDAKPHQLCPMCLRKLHSCTGFNILAREQALLKCYEAFGMKGEAEWEGMRIKSLQFGSP